MLNFADVAPDSTVTLEGTESAALELDSVTAAPAAGAGPVSSTELTVEVTPETIVAGEAVIDDSTGGTTVPLADFVTPP